jgi:negative regulator of sigma E activity
MKRLERLDDELRNALRRQEPPEGFEARLMARLAREPRPLSVQSRILSRVWEAISAWFQAPVFARAALAGALCLLVVCGVHYEQLQAERARGEAAKRQLLLALRVTGSSLREVQQSLRQVSAGYSSAQ